MDTRTLIHIKLLTSRDSIGLLMMVLIMLATAGSIWYVTAAVRFRTWTPGIELFHATPDGYQSVRAFRNARAHEFPALHEEAAPAAVAGTGRLRSIADGGLYGAGAGPNGPREVKTIHITRLGGPRLVAHLDVPLAPDLLDHLRSLRRGAIVTVTGIGHGDGESNIYIYPVHALNGYTP